MILAFYSEQSHAGKDTAADFAAEYLRGEGIEVVRDAFAWDGKVVCADALGIEGTRMEKIAAIDRLKLHGGVAWRLDAGDPNPTICTGREFIIGLLGSPDKGNGVRGLDEGFWTRQVVNRARAARERDAWTVISDLRFLEEADAIRQTGGWVVEIHRPHGSLGTFNEQRVPVDYRIINDGTKHWLGSQVTQYVRSLTTKLAYDRPR